MADIEVKCVERDCGKPFTITEGEQRFFKEKGFANPKRCKDCRKKRRADSNTVSAPRETYVPASYEPAYMPPPDEDHRARRDRGSRRGRDFDRRSRDESYDRY